MKDIFDGLESMGLENLESQQLFPKEDITQDDKALQEIKRKEIAKEILFDRKAECPICEMRFESRSVRSGKIRLVDTDTDLRPIYDKLDPILYDILVCPTCGYASLSKTFKDVNRAFVPAFKEKVSKQFISKEYPDMYTYEMAIERHKLALYDATILEKPNTEKAYLCLKIAWLYRGMRKELDQDDRDGIQECNKKERIFIKEAYDGFKISLDTDNLPILGFDILTIRFIIGELARRMGQIEESYKIMHQLKLHPRINQRLKKRVSQVMEIIRDTMEKEQKHAKMNNNKDQ